MKYGIDTSKRLAYLFSSEKYLTREERNFMQRLHAKIKKEEGGDRMMHKSEGLEYITDTSKWYPPLADYDYMQLRPGFSSVGLGYKITSIWYPTRADYEYMQRLRAAIKRVEEKGMGLGFAKVFGKSLVKGLKTTGTVLGVVAATAALTAGLNPEVWVPIAATLGPAGPVLLITAPLAVRTLLDMIKHRDKI